MAKINFLNRKEIKEEGGLREERKKDEACKSGDKRLPFEKSFLILCLVAAKSILSDVVLNASINRRND